MAKLERGENILWIETIENQSACFLRNIQKSPRSSEHLKSVHTAHFYMMKEGHGLISFIIVLMNSLKDATSNYTILHLQLYFQFYPRSTNTILLGCLSATTGVQQSCIGGC